MIRRQRRGQGYLEFVLILPGLLLLTFLIWEFAYFWWARQVTATATFEAARQVAVGRSTEYGYATYQDVLRTGLGRMAAETDAGAQFRLVVQPAYRAVWAQSNVPYHWPTGLGALMGGSMNLTLPASAFFRLEQFQPGPPDRFE